MTKLRALLAGAAIAALAFIGWAWSQAISPNTLTGSEAWNCGEGAGGPSFFCTANLMRNTTGYALVGTGGTVNTTVTAATAKLLATGAITTWNVTLENSPVDGKMLEISCPGGTATTVAVTAGTIPAGTTISGTAFTACTAGGAAANTAEWIYSLSANVWERIQ